MRKAKGDCPDRVHSDQMVLETVRLEAGSRERRPKALKTKLSHSGSIRFESTLRDSSHDGQVAG
jgi:hypothetical protein